MDKFAFNFKSILTEEIALEGLEGISLQNLWNHVSYRLYVDLTTKMKTLYWNFIITHSTFSFYRIPEPIAPFRIIDRFLIVDDVTGHLKEPEDYVDGPYQYSPIQEEFGSCQYYETRKNISTEELSLLSYEDCLNQYGDYLVIVASQEERWHALAPHVPISYMNMLTPVQYCILELIGKARENGQLTVGNTNLSKISKDPKVLFHNRRPLQRLDLINKVCVNQRVSDKTINCILLRLKRFHKPKLLSLPKEGQLIKLINHLKSLPRNMDEVSKLKNKSLLKGNNFKNFHKANNTLFKVVDEQVPTEDEKDIKKGNKYKRKKFLCLVADSDQSSESDEEMSSPIQCRYKLGENLMRQAYKRLLEAGSDGLTQVELGQTLGIQHYTVRSILCYFKERNIVKEYVQDKCQRQRTSRYVVTATDMDKRYTIEKEKFMDYLHQSNESVDHLDKPISKEMYDDCSDVPAKKMKIEDTSSTSFAIKESIVEVKTIEGIEQCNTLFDSKKIPSLRKLQYVNGIIKIVREKKVVSGFQKLNRMVAEEINVTPMDSKGVKRLLQQLVDARQLNIYKLIWPNNNNIYTILICAPQVKKDHQAIQATYKELCLRSYRSVYVQPIDNLPQDSGLQSPIYTYPKYMRAHKLHEFLFDLIYCKDEEVEEIMPEGFASLLNVISEMTIELALGHICSRECLELQKLKKNKSLLNIKVKDAPSYVCKLMLRTNYLVTSVRRNLRTLASFGLIQLCDQVCLQNYDYYSTNLSEYRFYLNRHAKIIDTKGKWPRNDADLLNLEKKFYFETALDVQNYWKAAYNICVNTTITTQQRSKTVPLVPIRQSEEVAVYDSLPTIYGDGFGPGGYHSGFFAELPRLWQTFSVEHFKIISRKKQKLFQHNIKPKVKPKPRKIAKKKEHKVKPNVVIKQMNLIRNKRRRRKPKSFTEWTKLEDDIIIMARVAAVIMSPMMQQGVIKITNFVAKDLITVCNLQKTASICNRRAILLEKSPSVIHKKEYVIEELRRRPFIMEKYGNILKKLRFKFSNCLSKYILEGQIRMMELIWIISKIISSKNFMRAIPCVATSIEDFHQSFYVHLNKTPNPYFTSSDCKSEIATMKEGVMMTINAVNSKHNTSDISSKILNIIKNCSELDLRNIVEQLRKSGAISAREKMFNYHFHKFSSVDQIKYSTSYKPSVLYQRQWITRFTSNFLDDIVKCVISSVPSTNVQGSAELCCILCELHANGQVDIITSSSPIISGHSVNEDQIPIQEIESNYRLKNGGISWSIKDAFQLSTIYNDIDIIKGVEALMSNSRIYKQENISGTNYYDKSNKLHTDIKALLEKKKEFGATLEEIQDMGDCNKDVVLKTLEQLENDCWIKRVGFYENRIALVKYTDAWSVTTDDGRIIPTPWMFLGLKLTPLVFINWCGTALYTIFRNPGCSMSFISKYCEYLTTRAAQQLCTFLAHYKCIKLKTVIYNEIGLFEEDDFAVELVDFNQYESPDKILAFPEQDCLIKYAGLRKKFFEYYNCSNL